MRCSAKVALRGVRGRAGARDRAFNVRSRPFNRERSKPMRSQASKLQRDAI